MAQHYGPNIVTDGLVLCLDAGYEGSYPGSGTTWSDLSGNNYDATLSAAAIGTDVPGTMEFNGSNEYATVSDNTALTALDNLTMEAWVKPVEDPTSTAYMDMIFKERAAAQDSGYVMMTDFDRIRIEMRIGGTNIGAYGTDGTFLLRIPSYHCLTVFDNTANLLSYYQDGELHQATAASGDGEFGSGKDLNFGRASNGTRYSNVDISIVRLYNKAFTAAEVKQNFNAQKSRFGL